MAVLCAYWAHYAYAAQSAPTLLSKKGEIQSVNKYSSNPYWNPDSPYNQRFPAPVYVSGPDLTSGDCNRVVSSLIQSYCTSNNNCANTRLSDARPTLMVQLSQLPGHGFATSCGGYIDSAFNDYKETYGNSYTANTTLNTGQSTSKTTTQTIHVDNPFTKTKSEYEIGVDVRTAELEQMQRMTTPDPTVTPTDFPKTVADLSFTDRVANATAGYEPYKDLNAYKTPKFETDAEYYERMKSVLEHTISYIGAGAANSGCPTKYMTGKGATVSCTPHIDNGTCTAWCSDSEKKHCNKKFTISSDDRDDKTFYAKCTCNTGYEMNGYKCVKPGTPVTPVNPMDPVTPMPTPTPTPDPGPTPISPNMNLPKCLQNIENDNQFQNALAAKLTNTNGDINAFLSTNKSELYNMLGEQVIDHCLNGDTNILSEFNTFLDDIPAVVSLNVGNIQIPIHFEELFDYIDYPTAVLVVNTRQALPANELQKSSITKSYFFNDLCSDHYVRIGSDGDTAVNKAAQSAYPITERGGEFFLDFPVGKSNRAFPGLLLINARYLGGAENIVVNTNYLIAHQSIKKFTENLQNSACSSDGLAAYTVKLPMSITKKSGRGWWNYLICTFCLIIPKDMENIQQVRIMDGPYIIK